MKNFKNRLRTICTMGDVTRKYINDQKLTIPI